MIYVKKKENETPGSLLYRFSKKIRRSGILREARKRKHYSRPQNRLKRKEAAIYKFNKGKEVEKAKKLGLL